MGKVLESEEWTFYYPNLTYWTFHEKSRSQETIDPQEDASSGRWFVVRCRGRPMTGLEVGAFRTGAVASEMADGRRPQLLG